ncbi:MAG: hypothetical protein KA436_04100 [Oligoflexales bacterium]|nr:hypothetical protein [Oligoflexales bacterium]
MKRSSVIKFPSSLQLFKFCQKVLSSQRGEKVHDQEIGSFLNFNPSDCSHWKRGEKNVKSVFALAKLAEVLKLEPFLLHDVASGATDLDEAYYEYSEAKSFRECLAQVQSSDKNELNRRKEQIHNFCRVLLEKANFSTPPLYLPEIFRLFPFIQVQPVDLLDKLSRILRSKPGHYILQHKKGDIKAQTRMSMSMDLAKIIFEGERSRYPVLGELNPSLLLWEKLCFATSILIPSDQLKMECSKLDVRKNVIAELSSVFWVPKSLVSFKLYDLLQSPNADFAVKVKAGLNSDFGLSPLLGDEMGLM